MRIEIFRVELRNFKACITFQLKYTLIRGVLQDLGRQILGNKISGVSYLFKKKLLNKIFRLIV